MRAALVALALILPCSLAATASAQDAAPPDDATAASDAAAPLDPASEAAPPPALEAPTTPAASAPNVGTVVVDAAAEQRYAACQALVAEGKRDEARACLRRVVLEQPGTSGARQAEAALFVLEASTPVAPGAASPSPATASDVTATAGASAIAPGRLGMGLALGLTGAFDGLAGGALLGINAPQLGGPTIMLVGGGAAVALGAAGGVGGYLLAEHLKLDEGATRLIGSGLVWGTVLGADGAAALLATAYPYASGNMLANGAIAIVVLAGWTGGGLAMLAATQLSFTEAQVSLMNSGGTLGWAAGGSIAMFVATMPGLGAPPVTGFAILGGGIVVGLGAGVVAGRVLDMTWGETLICDLGGVLGFIAGSAAYAAVPQSYSGETVHPEVLLPGGGALLGYAGTMAGVLLWQAARDSERTASNERGPSWQLSAPMVLDRTGRMVPAIGVGGEF